MVAIVAAVLALIAVNRVSGRDVAGTAVSVALPPIPAVGSCLDTRAAPPLQVDCAERHTAQVYQSWREGSPPAEISDRCASGGISWGVPMNPDWSPPQIPTFSTKLSSGDPLGWEVCAFVATVDGNPAQALSYVGSLHRGADGDPAAVIGSCFTDQHLQIDCATPHRIERIGVFQPVSPNRRPVTGCAEFAAGIIRPAAFSGADALRAVSGVDTSGLVGVTDGTTGEVIPLQTCSVVAPRPLVDSVRALGDKPLPFG